MVSRKYASDYRLENVKDKKGKIVTKPVYRGELYSFSKSKKEIKKLKKIFIISLILEWFIFLLSLFLNTRVGRAMYVVLPFLGVAFPLLGETDTIWAFLSSKGPMIRSEKDKITEKMVSWIFTAFLLFIFSFVGHIIFWIRNGETITDAIFLVLTVLEIALSWNLFSKRKDLEMVKTGTTKLPPEEEE